MATVGEGLAFERVDELVAPLRAYALRRGLPDTLDDNGRLWLASLSEDQLRHGVQRAQREADADGRIRKPLGLLVYRAQMASADFFAPPPPPLLRPAPTRADADAEPLADEEAKAAVAALEDAGGDELADVDEEARAWLAANIRQESIRRVMWRADQPALRQAAWRRLHPLETDASAAELAG